MQTEPLQTDEVEKHLHRCQECLLSHYDSGTSVLIQHDPDNGRSPWRVWCIFKEILDRPILERALALGFVLSGSPGRDHHHYELSKSFFGSRAAAIRSLELIRMLPGVLDDAWICVSIIEQDQLDEPRPEPPVPWPPI